jgi:hypothetical protein
VPKKKETERARAHGAEEVQAQMADQDDRRAVYLQKLHQEHRTLDEWAFYPEHDKRAGSPGYAKVHKTMVVAEDLPCLVCGVRNSTLKDASKNPYGAKQMETHHHIVEWALANAIDRGKFTDRILANLAGRNPDKYAKKDAKGNVVRDERGRVAPVDFTDDDVRAWVDHDRDNLWVLCDVHHRHKWLGIHAVSGPIWGPQDILVDDFQERVRKALTGLEKPAPAKRPRASGSSRPK